MVANPKGRNSAWLHFAGPVVDEVVAVEGLDLCLSYPRNELGTGVKLNLCIIHLKSIPAQETHFRIEVGSRALPGGVDLEEVVRVADKDAVRRAGLGSYVRGLALRKRRPGGEVLVAPSMGVKLDPLCLRQGDGRHRGNEMVKGREKSDDQIVPEGRRKAAPTVERRGGKTVTASKQVRQLELFSETADNPEGDVAGADVGQPMSATSAVPKSESGTRRISPMMMTMEEVASDGNLKRAFEAVASNDGAPGPDRQSIAEVRQHLGEILPN